MARDVGQVTILGCGSSGGVPRIGGHWGDCDPTNPKNTRTRCSILVERFGENGVTRALIDTGPDMRTQLVNAGIGEIDAAIWTHAHADHVHGLDDLRMITMNTRKRLQSWADKDTQEDLLIRFRYAFVQKEGSAYPPILELNTIDGPFTISGDGGDITLEPLRVQHGRIMALGFRIGDLAYIPDVSDIPDTIWPRLTGLNTWIVDALRRTPHPSHAHFDQALDWIERAQPQQAVLTNLHIDMDYDAVERDAPDHVTPAFDGMVLAFSPD